MKKIFIMAISILGFFGIVIYSNSIFAKDVCSMTAECEPCHDCMNNTCVYKCADDLTCDSSTDTCEKNTESCGHNVICTSTTSQVDQYISEGGECSKTDELTGNATYEDEIDTNLDVPEGIEIGECNLSANSIHDLVADYLINPKTISVKASVKKCHTGDLYAKITLKTVKCNAYVPIGGKTLKYGSVEIITMTGATGFIDNEKKMPCCSDSECSGSEEKCVDCKCEK